MANPKNKFKILVSDPLGKGGMSILNKDKSVEVDENTGLTPDQLKKIIGSYDAIVIRSGTTLTKDILKVAKKLRVIGRAGVGVDNVDLPTATKQGIIVMNTPEGNTISTAEHSFSMLMALARNIPQAYQSVKRGEWKRKDFLGTQLQGKVLGVVGFGRIGREVAKRASAFGMKIVTFDPFISKGSVKEHPVEFMDLKSMLKVADFITMHTPLSPDTKHLLNEETLKFCKKGVRIVNCARGGIIDEKALEKAVKAGIVAGVALDVFENEPPGDHPLLKYPQVIATPHLGAATQEAQENVAIDVAKQVLDALHGSAIKNAVNLPNLDPETLKVAKPWITVSEKIGLLQAQLYPGSLTSVTIRLNGEPSRFGFAPFTIAVLKGILTPPCGDTVNFVNAPALAKERGVEVHEKSSNVASQITNSIEVEAKFGKETHKIVGTLYGNDDPRIVQIDEFFIEIEPSEYVLVIKNDDRPGVVGKLGMILGENKINIAQMTLGRLTKDGKVYALTVIKTDNPVPDKVLKEIRTYAPIIDAKVVTLN
jgi:D-3-phosphoglycerate dehydrogenase